MVNDLSHPAHCDYVWQASGNVFEIDVSIYDINREEFQRKVWRWTQLYNVMQDSGEEITHTMEEGSQHGQSYYETFAVSEGSARTCPTMFIGRFFELGDSDDSLIRVEAKVCRDNWRDLSIRTQIWSILDSFRLIQNSESE